MSREPDIQHLKLVSRVGYSLGGSIPVDEVQLKPDSRGELDDGSVPRSPEAPS